MKIVCVLLVLSFLWIVFSPRSGVLTLLGKQSDRKALQQETAQIQQQIKQMETDIKQLQNDPKYLEDLARKKYKLLKKNETRYVFPKSDN